MQTLKVVQRKDVAFNFLNIPPPPALRVSMYGCVFLNRQAHACVECSSLSFTSMKPALGEACNWQWCTSQSGVGIHSCEPRRMTKLKMLKEPGKLGVGQALNYMVEQVSFLKQAYQ